MNHDLHKVILTMVLVRVNEGVQNALVKVESIVLGFKNVALLCDFKEAILMSGIVRSLALINGSDFLKLIFDLGAILS